MRFNYHRLSISGYGSATAVTADAGVLFQLSRQVSFGLQLNNPINGGAEGLRVPALYVCGLGYEPSEILLFSLEVVKRQSQPPAARIGTQYAASPQILLRMMIQTRDPSLWFGAGLQRGSYRLDVFSNYHMQLGMGMGLALYCYFSAGG